MGFSDFAAGTVCWKQIVPAAKYAGIAAQRRKGYSPLYGTKWRKTARTFRCPGCLPRRAHIQGLPLYRSAPLVPKGLFYVNRSVYLFSLNHFNAFICWVELKRILDCHKRSGIIPAICHSFFHCCHCRISGSHQIPVIPLPILPDRCSFRNFGLNLFYEHPSKGILPFYTLSHFLSL